MVLFFRSGPRRFDSLGTEEKRRRMYPRAAVAVSIFIMRRGGVIDPFLVLVKRGRPPAAGQLALPGGKCRLGESLSFAAIREVHEETGLHVELPDDPSFCASDAITRDANTDAVAYHYSIAHLLAYVRCDDDTFPLLRASSDAVGAYWIHASDITTGRDASGTQFVSGTARVVTRALDDWKRRGFTVRQSNLKHIFQQNSNGVVSESGL